MEDIIQSPLGTLRIIVNQGKLVYCNWEEEDCRSKLQKIRSLIPHEGAEEKSDMKLINDVKLWVKEYFDGTVENFDFPILFIGTEFQKSVWLGIMKVGYGETISYHDLSRLIGKPDSSRAVANACGANPVALIIPCHRIIRSDGEAGGYTGGADKKLWLQEFEKNNTKKFGRQN